jgi:hypothetical protein
MTPIELLTQKLLVHTNRLSRLEKEHNDGYIDIGIYESEARELNLKIDQYKKSIEILLEHNAKTN